MPEIEPRPRPFPLRAAVDGSVALAAGAWFGLAEGARAAFLGPRPFEPADVAACVAAHAAVAVPVGVLGAGAVRRMAGAGPTSPLSGAGHAVAFALGALILLGRLLPRRHGTDSLPANAALAAVAVALLAALLLLHARRRARRGAVPEPRARSLPRAAAQLVPWVAAAAALATPWTPGDLSTPPPVLRRTDGARAPNVLVVLVDSLRADRVGACGGSRGLTPALDAFARGGTAFRTARTSSPWTKPAVASLHTGLRPERHGVVTVDAVLPRGAPTLLEFLQRAGYRTAVLTDSHWPVPEFGFDRGVDGLFLGPDAGGIRATALWRTLADIRDFLVDAYRVEKPASVRGAADLGRRFLRWVDGEGERPWAAYLHWMEPHHPYAPPRDGGSPRPRVPVPVFLGTVPLDRCAPLPAADHANLVANYDDEVRVVDGAFAALVAGLEERGHLERTIVVFVSDHGEEFHEHGGWTHGHSLLDEVVRVPLIVRAPGGLGAGRTVDAPVRIEDILPTVLDLAAIETDAPFDGRSLVPLMRGEADPPRATWGYCRRISSPTRLYAAADGGRKLLLAVRDDLRREWLYDLNADPGELDPAAPAPPSAATDGPGAAAVAHLRRRIAEALDITPLVGAGATVDASTREALAGWGYLGGAGDGR